MAKSPITAASLGITGTTRKIREVVVLPRGGLKTTRVKERAVTVAAIPALDRIRKGPDDE